MKKILLASILVLMLFGCSNDSLFEGLSDESSLEATLEEAAIALDDEDYDEVIHSLASIYTTTALNPEVARLLASGYMGKAGIDLTNFITYSAYEDADPFDAVEATLSLFTAPIVKNEDDKDERICNAMDRTVLIITNDAVFIDRNCIGELLDYLDNVKNIFYSLQEAEMESLEDIFQLGITSATHFVFIVGDATANAFGSTSVPINKEAYRVYKDNASSWENVDASVFGEEDVNEDGLTPYQEDLINVNNAIQAIEQAIPQSNALKDELDGFLREILMMPTGDITDAAIIETVTSTGIFDYVNSL